MNHASHGYFLSKWPTKMNRSYSSVVRQKSAMVHDKIECCTMSMGETWDEMGIRNDATSR